MRSKKGIVETILLKEEVTPVRKSHSNFETGAEVDRLEFRNIRLQQSRYFSNKLLESGRVWSEILTRCCLRLRDICWLVENRVIIWDLMVEFRPRKLDQAVDKIAQIRKELGIILLDEHPPFKLGVLCFRSR